MVKGVSRQVIVVQAPRTELFDQAIFILKDGSKGVTDEALLKEAKQALRSVGKKIPLYYYGPVWALAGALLASLVWALTTL